MISLYNGVVEIYGIKATHTDQVCFPKFAKLPSYVQYTVTKDGYKLKAVFHPKGESRVILSDNYVKSITQ